MQSNYAHAERAANVDAPKVITDSAAVANALLRYRQRRQFVVDPESQRRLMWQFALHLLLAVALGVGLNTVLTNLFDLFGKDLLASSEVGTADKLLLWGYVVAFVAIGLAILTLVSLFFSHRIAGPAVKIGQALSEMACGNLRVCVRLRTDDHLEDVAQMLNTACRSWRTTLEDLQHTIVQIKADEATLDHAKLMEHVAALEATLRPYAKSLHTVGPDDPTEVRGPNPVAAGAPAEPAKAD